MINVKNLLLASSFAVFLAAVLAGPVCVAQTTTTKRYHKTTTTTVESDEDGDGIADVATTNSNEISESEISTVFGSRATSGFAGCKTEEQAKMIIKGLKSDCSAWVKDQKSDLGKRYLTSTCEEACADCGTSLQRCTVTGTVRYHKATNP